MGNNFYAYVLFLMDRCKNDYMSLNAYKKASSQIYLRNICYSMIITVIELILLRRWKHNLTLMGFEWQNTKKEL